MDTILSLGYWIRLALVAVAALFAFVAALRRARTKAERHDLAVGIVTVLAVIAIVVLTGPDVSYLVLGAALLVGIAVGFGIARVRLLVSALLALTGVFMLVMALFGEIKAFGIGMAAFAFGAGVQLGQGLRRVQSRPSGAAVPTGSAPLQPAGVAPVQPPGGSPAG